MIKITINDKEIELEQPGTILEAARGAGIKIPTLCHHDWLKMYGGCRLCLVEIEKMPRLQPACSFMVSDGMVVTTESEQISAVRRSILEFLLINHPLDCPFCDKSGECELQDAVYMYGPSSGRFKEPKIKHTENNIDPVLARNMERCIACTRCVRMCEDVQGAYAIAMTNRGDRTLMEPFSGDRFDCEYCGNCLTVCPVGSILARPSKSSYRPWQMDDNITTVCGYCGVGCLLELQVRDEEIKKIIPVEDSALRSSLERFGPEAIGKNPDRISLNHGLLCALGRFGYEYVASNERLTSPMVRKGGKLVETSWDEALDVAALKFNEIKKSDGSSALAGIASPRCTNEDNYVFQKFMRGILGTNNIDSTARLGFAGAQAYLESLRGQGITANPIAELENADVVFVVGGDPTVLTPVLGLQIRAAAKKGAKIITLGLASGLDRCHPTKIIPNLFTENKILERLSALLLLKKEMKGELPAFEEQLKAMAAAASAEEAKLAKVTGIAKADIVQVADIIAASESLAVVIGNDIIQRAEGHCGLFCLAGISYLATGRIFLLSDRPNEQGLIDMGCLPDTLPGGLPLSALGFREKYEETCGLPVPPDDGLTLFQMFQSISEGQIKGLYVMGENPALNLPNWPICPSGDTLKSKIENLDFLVVQDIFLTETAAMADVVFPALSWAEREGSYTNLEHRIQMLRRSVKNRQGKNDWQIIAEISDRMDMGTAMKFSSAADIMAEIVRVSPIHRDLRYPDIEKGTGTMLCLTYKDESSGSEVSGVIHGDIIKNSTKTCDRHKENGEKEKQKKFALLVEHSLFYSGVTSRKASALSRLRPEAVLKMHPEDAAASGIVNGGRVKVSSLSGEETFDIDTVFDNSVSRGAIKLPGYLEGCGAFSLITNLPVDPVTKAPAFEECRVLVEAI